MHLGERDGCAPGRARGGRILASQQPRRRTHPCASLPLRQRPPSCSTASSGAPCPRKTALERRRAPGTARRNTTRITCQRALCQPAHPPRFGADMQVSCTAQSRARLVPPALRTTYHAARASSSRTMPATPRRIVARLRCAASAGEVTPLFSCCRHRARVVLLSRVANQADRPPGGWLSGSGLRAGLRAGLRLGSSEQLCGNGSKCWAAASGLVARGCG